MRIIHHVPPLLLALRRLPGRTAALWHNSDLLQALVIGSLMWIALMVSLAVLAVL